MTPTYLKKALPVAPDDDPATRSRVAELLANIRQGREAAARALALQLDGWSGDIAVPAAAFSEAEAALKPQVKEDIQYAHQQILAFAERQRESLTSFECTLPSGLIAGQRLIPLDVAGCYVPGGRYAHIASALMSVTTAHAAGVRNIVVASPPRDGAGVHPAVLYALQLAGADQVLCLGGVQGVAALALGLFSDLPADIVVGPGNRFVTEAKRQLFGAIGIDLVAGPSEVLIIADASADPHLVALDLVGQAEHGPDTPAVLLTTDRTLAEEVLRRVPLLIDQLQDERSAQAATAAWRDRGEVVLVNDREEACQLSDRYASEHLEVHAADLPFWLERLRNYGSLFLGEETTVAYGDKTSGPNHILPTRGAARYTGGLSVHKFLKVLTYQRMPQDCTSAIAGVTARISRLEGMEAHALTAEARIEKYASASS